MIDTQYAAFGGIENTWLVLIITRYGIVWLIITDASNALCPAQLVMFLFLNMFGHDSRLACAGSLSLSLTPHIFSVEQLVLEPLRSWDSVNLGVVR